MQKITIRPVWTIQAPEGGTLPPRVLELLVQVQAQGSLLAACQALGMSYRHGWDLVRQGEAQFGTTLLHMERGKGSTLTPLGEKLVWADHRITARLKPVLDSLASELAVEIGRTVQAQPTVLRIQASHGFAVEALVERLQQNGQAVELRYVTSTAAAAALHDGACDAAGFHLPEGALREQARGWYGRWLADEDLRLIDVATRRQGLMVAPGNPRKVYELADLLRPEVRFINRQAGSGTRLLLEGLLAQAGLDAGAIPGFEQGEFTHAAVAAFVASGMADVGFGLETPARHFKLDFLPLASERYFLLCRASSLATPALQALLGVLHDPDFQARVDALPGYAARHCGRVEPLPPPPG
ncbi:helix-turn-helix transcriptional regulator [Ideonella sp. TBM-1]|uniref:Helix-turn-helix transcriptional regulator n=2 Tax=Ideonella livida TaxID=2707176 RepID=A0A7C9TMC3_9BURK|nr:helix-turn-helix transcriptional regulator [Ideonella livida]